MPRAEHSSENPADAGIWMRCRESNLLSLGTGFGQFPRIEKSHMEDFIVDMTDEEFQQLVNETWEEYSKEDLLTDIREDTE